MITLLSTCLFASGKVPCAVVRRVATSALPGVAGGQQWMFE